MAGSHPLAPLPTPSAVELAVLSLLNRGGGDLLLCCHGHCLGVPAYIALCCCRSTHLSCRDLGQNKNCPKQERLYSEYGSLNYHLKISTKIFFNREETAGTALSKNASERPQEASCFSAPDIGCGPAAKCSDFGSACLGWK